MRIGGPEATRLLAQRLPQPDDVSCGAASSVVARVVRDEAYAALLLEGSATVPGFATVGTALDRFRSETLAMHRRIIGPVAATGGLQMPWPSKLGTPPWAVANQLSAGSVRYRWRPALGGLPVSAIRSAVLAGHPAAAYVGNLWSPRHVVLVVGAEDDGGLAVFDPWPGQVVTLTPSQLAQGSLPFGRWNRAWFVVLPE